VRPSLTGRNYSPCFMRAPRWGDARNHSVRRITMEVGAERSRPAGVKPNGKETEIKLKITDVPAFIAL